MDDLNDMRDKDIKLGRIQELILYGRAFQSLSRIVLEKGNIIYKLLIDIDEKIDGGEIIDSMEKIGIGKALKMELHAKEFLLLSKISFEECSEIGFLLIKVTGTSSYIPGDMKFINILFVNRLSLDSRETYLLPKTIFSSINRLRILELKTEISEFPHKSEIKQIHDQLKNINKIIINKGLEESKKYSPEAETIFFLKN
eukprot:GHVP01067455.1.p1 GENE.GHVP01067455.1~~GHVP01067455.1.p1  ORF type:complete len:199 (+),score=34.17 GHVP01067455.1:2675-3271(+)